MNTLTSVLWVKWIISAVWQGDTFWKGQFDERRQPGDRLRPDAHAAAGAQRLDNTERHEAAEAGGAAHDRARGRPVLRTGTCRTRYLNYLFCQRETQATLILMKFQKKCLYSSWTWKCRLFFVCLFCAWLFRLDLISCRRRLALGVWKSTRTAESMSGNNFFFFTDLVPSNLWSNLKSVTTWCSFLLTALFETCPGADLSHWRPGAVWSKPRDCSSQGNVQLVCILSFNGKSI